MGSTRPPVLSTTTLLDQFNQGKFTDLITAVNKHVKDCPNDDTSAVKVIKTLASVTYKKNLPEDHIHGLIDCVVKCVAVIKNFAKVEVIKDVYNSLYYILRRLDAQGKGELLVGLCESYYSLLDSLENVKDVASTTFNVYVVLWNLVAVSEPKLSSDNVQFLLTTMQIQNYAMKFYLGTSDTDKFSMLKLVQKTKSSAKTYLAKNSSSQVFKIIMENISLILKDRTVQRDSQSSWELWLFCIEMGFKRDMIDHISVIMDLKDHISKHCAQVVKFVDFLIKLHQETSGPPSSEELDANISEVNSSDLNFSSLPELYRAALLTLFHDLLELNQIGATRVIKSSNSRLVSICEMLLKLCSEPSLLPTAILVNKTANFFALLIISKWKEASIDQDLLDLSNSIVKYHEECVKLMNKPDWLKYWRSSANQLTVNTYNLGALLYKAFKIKEAELLFQASCRSCVELWKFDPVKGPNPRSRYKLVSECQSKLGRHKAALVSSLTSLVYCLDEKLTRKDMMERIHQYGRSWISIKKDWLKLGEEVEAEVHSTGVVSLLGEGLEVEVGEEMQKRLAREEVGWHRVAYSAGVDLSASWVDSAGAVLKLSSSASDKAMMLVEQSWVFWLGDNDEDLEMAARCCEKAEKLLSGVEGMVGRMYLGLALYWRYMCEHRMLQMQVVEALEKAALVPVLPERREVGEEAVDPRDVDEVVPAFAGLQMEVEDKLVEWLERAVVLWEGLEGEVECDWINSKTLLDFVSAVGWELTRLARWVLAVRVWWLLWKLGRRLGEMEHVMMAAAELVKGGVEGEVLKFLLVEGKKLETIRSNNSTAMSAGVALLTVALEKGEQEKARKILEDLLQSPVIRQNSLRFNMVECEVRVLASQMRNRPGQWVDLSQSLSVNSLGPMDLALEAWRQVSMCQMWWEKDIRTPGVQDPGLLVVGPRLTCLELRAKAQMVRLYSQMAAPREMRCYIKEGLKTAQRNCLPLRSCELLLEMAKSNLLCDDEQLALTQLAGAKFTLGDALCLEEVGGKKRVEKVDDDKILRLPGQSDQSMSPALVRTQQCRPSWLDHPQGCPCSRCTSPRLHSCLLQYTGLRAAALHMGGEVSEAINSFDATASLFEGLKVKLKSVVKMKGVSSSVGSQVKLDHLEVWYHQVECLGRDRQWDQAKAVLDSQKKLISSLPRNHLLSRPSVLVRHLDQVVAIDRAVSEELTRKIAVLDLNVESLLSPGVARLSLGDERSLTPTSKPVTPTVDCKPNTAIKAPSKRDLPSLGPGETDTLAKNLDNLLIDVVEGEDTPEPVKPQSKPARRRKPKLEKIMDVEKMTPLGIKALPKVVVSEGTPTPRKFFKSKEEETPINFKTKAKEPDETPLKFKIKTSTAKPKLALSPIENVAKGRSGKDPYNIFEDPLDTPKTAFKTPAPTTVRASARKSATKSSAKTTTRTSSRTKSVSKPPKMANLTEVESPQRPRRTRSNRL